MPHQILKLIDEQLEIALEVGPIGVGARLVLNELRREVEPLVLDAEESEAVNAAIHECKRQFTSIPDELLNTAAAKIRKGHPDVD